MSDRLPITEEAAGGLMLQAGCDRLLIIGLTDGPEVIEMKFTTVAKTQEQLDRANEEIAVLAGFIGNE